MNNLKVTFTSVSCNRKTKIYNIKLLSTNRLIWSKILDLSCLAHSSCSCIICDETPSMNSCSRCSGVSAQEPTCIATSATVFAGFLRNRWSNVAFLGNVSKEIKLNSCLTFWLHKANDFSVLIFEDCLEVDSRYNLGMGLWSWTTVTWGSPPSPPTMVSSNLVSCSLSYFSYAESPLKLQ